MPTFFTKDILPRTYSKLQKTNLKAMPPFNLPKTNILKKSANAIDKKDLLCYYNKAVEKRAGMAELADARDLKSRG